MVALAQSIEYEGLEGIGIFPIRSPARCNVWRYLEGSMPYQRDCLGVMPQQCGSAMILVEIAAQERLTEAVLLLIRLATDNHLEVTLPGTILHHRSLVEQLTTPQWLKASRSLMGLRQFPVDVIQMRQRVHHPGCRAVKELLFIIPLMSHQLQSPGYQ
jgi:hypothetical protein